MPERRIGRRGRGGGRRRRIARPDRARRPSATRYAGAAARRLRALRHGSALAIGLTGALLLLLGEPTVELGGQETPPAQEPLAQEPVALDTTVPDSIDPGAAVAEATGTLRDLGTTAVQLLPRMGIALGLLAAAALLAVLFKGMLRRALGSWERANAFSALASVAIWLVALGAALSVIAGDARALVGSVGLFGLALSWALQAPIESFTGWLLNSFRGYYRVGDRIEVGDVFGDVARVDFLTTTVWEAGGPDKPVQAAQPTGALVTFPNSEVLRANVVNYTRDFPYVWDEVTIGVAGESDLPHTVTTFQRVASAVLGGEMVGPAERYRALLDRARLDYEISPEPQVYAAPTEAFTNVTVRYLVPARQRRVWATRLFLALNQEMARADHRGRIVPGYPRTQVDLGADARRDLKLSTS